LYFSVSSLTIFSKLAFAILLRYRSFFSLILSIFSLSSSSGFPPLKMLLIKLPIFHIGENTCNISGLYQAVIAPPNNNISKAIIFLSILSSFSLWSSYLSFHFSISLFLSAFSYSSFQSICDGLL